MRRAGSRGSTTLADSQQLVIARLSNSNSSLGQLQAGSTVGVTVPAGNPTRLSSGQESRNFINGSTSQGSELLTLSLAGSDSLIASHGVGEDVESMTSSERGQNGKQSSSRRNHYCCWVCGLLRGRCGVVEYLYERSVARQSQDTAFQIQMYNSFNLSINGKYCISKQMK